MNFHRASHYALYGFRPLQPEAYIRRIQSAFIGALFDYELDKSDDKRVSKFRMRNSEIEWRRKS